MLPDVITFRQALRVPLRLALTGALLGAIPSASAQDLGRIFFTPQQRQDLDRRRNLNVTE